MGIVISASIFVFGLVLGSFTNVLIYRIPRKISWKWTRSFCPTCHHTLSRADLLPLASFALFKGRCRYCGKRISIQYPVIELVVAVLSVLAWVWIRPEGSMDFSGWLMLGWVIVLIPIVLSLFMIDWQHMILPDELVVAGIGWTAFYRLGLIVVEQGEVDWHELLWIGVGSLGLALFFWLLILMTRGAGMGFGDVKLAVLVGLVSGWPEIIVSVFAAFVLGAVVGIGLILVRRKGMKSEIPFGPFLIIGTGIGLVWGEKFIEYVF